MLFALYGVYAASTEGISKAWISDLISDESRGSAIGLATLIMGICVMLGSFITGILWDKFGSQIPFVISASVSLMLSIIVWLKNKLYSIYLISYSSMTFTIIYFTGRYSEIKIILFRRQWTGCIFRKYTRRIISFVKV